ncbi:hypothetical protein NSA56_14490 [Oceanobacillus caeni]|nr:hypothetical protein [Oceanobacillus caeni]MCR1835567.1 hypothetical protein [Oceanobacillus caeni]
MEQKGTPSITKMRNARYCHGLSTLEFTFYVGEAETEEETKAMT